MIRTIPTAAALLLLVALDATTSGAPDLVIIKDGKKVDGTLKLFHGESARFFAVREPDADAPFELQLAVRMVRWRLSRIQGIGDERPSSPGVVVSDRSVWWKETWGFFAVPYDLAPPATAGRYVLSASQRNRGGAEVALTVAVLRLVVIASTRTEDAYDATFRITLSDPDHTGPVTTVDVVSADLFDREVDRAAGVSLVRNGDGYDSITPIRVSSRDTAGAGGDAASRSLRIVPGGSLRVVLGDRVLAVAVPLRPSKIVVGNVVAAPARGSRRTRQAPAVEPRDEPAAIRIVSSAGSGRRVKVWAGWPVTFAARLRDPGVEGMFAPTEWLDDVTWTWTRHRPEPPPPDAIIPGRKQRRETLRPPASRLWGDPPPVLTVKPKFAWAGEGGHRVLRAERPDGASASIRVDVAAFGLHDHERPYLKQEARRKRYSAKFRFRLIDPTERRRQVPVEVRLVDPKGKRLDERRGVVLTRVHGLPYTFLSQTIYLSSDVKAPCRARYERRKRFDPRSGEKPPPEPPLLPVLKVSFGSKLRVELDGFVFDYPLPL